MSAAAAPIPDQITRRNAEAIKWMPLAYRIARDYWRAGPGKKLGTIHDGFQIAMITLLRAIELYRPERGAFSTYAYSCIRWRLHNAVTLRRHWSAEALTDVILRERQEPEGVDLEELFACLKPRERDIIERHFLRRQTYREMAIAMGISRQRCNQLCLRALAKMRVAGDSSRR